MKYRYWRTVDWCAQRWNFSHRALQRTYRKYQFNIISLQSCDTIPFRLFFYAWCLNLPGAHCTEYPIYVFLEKELYGLSPKKFLRSCICKRFICKAVGETRDWWIEGEASPRRAFFFLIPARYSNYTRYFEFRKNSNWISPSSFPKIELERSIDFEEYIHPARCPPP